MKVFISSDFEGVSGIVAWEQIISPSPEYSAGCALLMAEVNAAITGAQAAGATEFVVNDSHATMRNLDPAALAGEATCVTGRHKPLYMMEGLDSTFDAVFLVGYHGSIGRQQAILSHSYNPGTIWEARIDGQIVGETALNALVAAHFGVPIVLITGDGPTAEEARALMPQIETVVVKDSISRFAAANMHPQVARRTIAEGARRSIERSAAIAVPRFARPTVLDLTFLTADMADMATWITGVERSGERAVRLTDENTLDLYRRFVTLVTLTRALGAS